MQLYMCPVYPVCYPQRYQLSVCSGRTAEYSAVASDADGEPAKYCMLATLPELNTHRCCPLEIAGFMQRPLVDVVVKTRCADWLVVQDSAS